MLPLDAIRRATSRNSTMLVLTTFELYNKVHEFWEGDKDETMFVEFSKKIQGQTKSQNDLTRDPKRTDKNWKVQKANFMFLAFDCKT